MNSLSIVSLCHRNHNAHLASRYKLNISRENIIVSNRRALINFKKSI